ncbi:hypothetical protein ACFUTV_40495 [Streptomyces sp. NPDC057298]|uniref:hypothetical protein n=1 Tax=Streptomyces sp. NPDC057298 TaxID=3346091 RepID=UPI0036370D2C
MVEKLHPMKSWPLILSEILGVHINTAVDRVRFVKRDWAAFIEAVASSVDGSRESR